MLNNFSTQKIINNNKEGYSVFCLDCNQADFHNGVFRVQVEKQGAAGMTPDRDDLGSKTSSESIPREDETSKTEDAPPGPNRTEEIEVSSDVVYENFRVSGTLRAGQEARITVFFLPGSRFHISCLRF